MSAGPDGPGVWTPAARSRAFQPSDWYNRPRKQPDARERRSAIRGASTPIYMPEQTTRRGCLDPCAHGLTAGGKRDEPRWIRTRILSRSHAFDARAAVHGPPASIE